MAWGSHSCCPHDLQLAGHGGRMNGFSHAILQKMELPPINFKACFELLLKDLSIMAYLSTIQQITIPPLVCSLPLAFHKNQTEIKEKLDSWMFSQFNPSSEHQKKLLIQSGFPLLTSTAYANGKMSRVVCVGKCIAWMFALDDINDNMDNGVGNNSLAAEELFQALGDALEAKDSNSDGQLRRKAVAIALDWWAEIHPDMSPALQQRFLRTFKSSVDACKSQIIRREKGTIPDVQTYIQQRRKASACLPCFVLSEYSLGIEIDEEVLSHPLISELHDAVNDVISWVNDLLSLNYEYSRGEYDNLPSVVCFNHESHDMQTSVEIVCQMIKERDADCVRILKEIRGSELIKRPGLESYVAELCHWVSGNLLYSYVSARYHGVDEKPKAQDAPLQVLLRGPNANGLAQVDLPCIELELIR